MSRGQQKVRARPRFRAHYGVGKKTPQISAKRRAQMRALVMKDQSKLTPAERRIVDEFVGAVMDRLLHELCNELSHQWRKKALSARVKKARAQRESDAITQFDIDHMSMSDD